MANAYVIVGGSLAGATAAVTLREEGADGPVTLIGAERELPYERPPLSKAFLRGEVAFEGSLVHKAAFYAAHRIETVSGVRATRIDTDARAVVLEDRRRVPFDRLLIATGGRNRRLAVHGSELAGIYSLRTVDDAVRIKAEMSPGRRVVVVGMGFIGSEVAASLRQKGLDVVAIEPAKTPLFRVLGEAVGHRIADLHRAHGVRTIFEDTVAAFEGTQRVRRVITKGGLRLDCDFVVAGVGTQPVVDILDGTGIHVDNGVVVDACCQTSVPGIYAAGDVANHYHPVFERQIRVEHWQNAIKQGAAAARNMLGRAVPYDEIHWFWSDQYEANLQYAGFHTTWDQLVVRGRLEAGDFLACYVNDGRIDAVVGLNRGKDVRRAIPLIKSRRRLDLGELRDESIDLRSLNAGEQAKANPCRPPCPN